MSEMIGVRVASNGRLVLPKAIRSALGLKDAGTIVMSVDDGEVRITSTLQRVKKAQAYYRANVVDDFSTDDFLAERRKEALEEDRKHLAD
jgi:AbrB family looped-hinge helix DNA binding protein